MEHDVCLKLVRGGREVILKKHLFLLRLYKFVIVVVRLVAV